MTTFTLCRRLLTLPLILLAGAAAAQRQAPNVAVVKPKADASNVRYGPHRRNVLDLWLAKSDTPAPLVLFVHGGGFVTGDKITLPAARLRAYLDAGFSVAAIDYRYTTTAPAPAATLPTSAPECRRRARPRSPRGCRRC